MGKFQYFQRLVYFTGLCTLSCFGYQTYMTIKPLFYHRSKNLQQLKTSYGNGYAIVTGPTSGIGLAFANELSRIGFDVCLIGRDQKRLEALKKNIERDYNTHPLIIEHDFYEGSSEKLKLLKASINKLNDISIVVNNVGAQYENSRKFESLSSLDLIRYVNVNMLSQLSMYNSVLSKLRYQKHKSLVIDVSSIVSDNDVMAGNILYTSTKTFNLRFSNLIKFQMETENLIRKVQVYDVDVAVFKPGAVETNLGFKNSGDPRASADKSVACCLYDVANGKFETNGVFSHSFTNLILKIVPKSIVNKVYTYKRYKSEMTEHENIVENEN